MRVLVWLFSIVYSAQLWSCQLTIGLEDFNPQSRKISEDTWEGRDIETIRKFLSFAHCQYNIIELPWVRGLAMLADGQIDMMINVTKTRSRELDYHFIGPVNNEAIVLATNQGNDYQLTHVQDILKLKRPIAVQRGAYYGELIMQLITSPIYGKHFIEVTDNETKMHLMKSGRVAGFLEARRNLTHGPDLSPRYTGIGFEPLVLHQTEVYYALSKKSIDSTLLKKLEQAFQQLTLNNRQLTE